jgi:hypothetical protein
MDPQKMPDQRKYSVREIRCERFNAYYRVMVDGVELPSTVYIMPSQKTARSTEQLKTWCKRNSDRLADGQVVQADLSGSARGMRVFSLFLDKLRTASLSIRR